MEEPAAGPGTKRTSKGCLVALWIGLMFMASIPLFFAARQVQNGYAAWQLRPGGASVDATVFVDSGHREPARYKFQVNGDTHTGTTDVGRVGDVIRVVYLRRDPDVNRPEEGLLFDIIFGAGVGAGAVVYLIVLIAAIVRKPQKPQSA